MFLLIIVGIGVVEFMVQLQLLEGESGVIQRKLVVAYTLKMVVQQ